MGARRMNGLRKALMWFFRAPGTAYVTINLGVDFSRAAAYLDGINAERADGEGSVSVHHLVCASVARVLDANPDANARIVGRHIARHAHVTIAMPVNLIGHEGGARFETTIMALERVDAMNVREVASTCRDFVGRERKGATTNPLLETVNKLVDRIPYAAVAGLLRGVDGASRHPAVAKLLHEKLSEPTCVVSNVGSAFGQQEGGWFRGAAMSPPQFNMFHVGTIWGVSALQDEAVPVKGKVEIRPMLPIVLVFDHRLIDGVRASHLAKAFIAVLQDPEGNFGVDGRGRIGGQTS